MTAGFPTHHVMNIRPDGSGNVTETHITWHSTEAKNSLGEFCFASPAVSQGQLFLRGEKHLFAIGK